MKIFRTKWRCCWQGQVKCLCLSERALLRSSFFWFLPYNFLTQLHCFTLLVFILGIFTLETFHSSLTICPHHREKYGLRWRSGKVKCSIPSEMAGHKSLTAKGDRGMSSKESLFIANTVRQLYPIGTRKLYCIFNQRHIKTNI